MRELAKITRIQKIEPIANKDKIELATIENYPVIIQKEIYKEGDLVVYIFYDTILPVREEFEFLRDRCWSKLYQGFRIRNMAMAGVYSSGIIFPLSILPEKCKIIEGKDVSDILEIRKYDPEALKEEREFQQVKIKHGALWHWLCRFKWFRRFFFKKKSHVVPYPSTVKKSDEENIEKLFNHLQEQHPVARYYVTEKMEGQAGTWMVYGKRRKYLVYSRNTPRNPKGLESWGMISKRYELEKILRSEKENYAIQGEICGPGIQENIYKFPALRLFVYKVTNTATGKTLDYQELREFCIKHKLTMVPVLEVDVPLPKTLDDILTHCQGYSILSHHPKEQPLLREGLVYRCMTNQELSFKAKSREYAVWFEKGRKTE